MKANDLKTMSDEQLVHKSLELERTLLAHTFRHRLGQLDNTSVLRATRKDIARAKTALTQREQALREELRVKIDAAEATYAASATNEDREKNLETLAALVAKYDNVSLVAQHKGSFVPTATSSAPEAGSGFLQGVLDKSGAAE